MLSSFLADDGMKDNGSRETLYTDYLEASGLPPPTLHARLMAEGMLRRGKPLEDRPSIHALGQISADGHSLWFTSYEQRLIGHRLTLTNGMHTAIVKMGTK